MIATFDYPNILVDSMFTGSEIYSFVPLSLSSARCVSTWNEMCFINKMLLAWWTNLSKQNRLLSLLVFNWMSKIQYLLFVFVTGTVKHVIVKFDATTVQLSYWFNSNWFTVVILFTVFVRTRGQKLQVHKTEQQQSQINTTCSWQNNLVQHLVQVIRHTYCSLRISCLNNLLFCPRTWNLWFWPSPSLIQQQQQQQQCNPKSE